MEYNPNDHTDPSYGTAAGGYTYVYDGSFSDSEDNGRKKRKKLNSGCLPMVLAVAALTVLLVMLFIQLDTNSRYRQELSQLTPSAPVQPSELPNVTEDIGGNSFTSPELTPNVTHRPDPIFDGTQPLITDPSNPFPEIFEAASRGVVGIYNYAGRASAGQLQGSGTGFLISEEGYILTNAHVIDGAARITVIYPSDFEEEAELIGYDQTTDLAVLKIINVHNELSPLCLGSSADVRVGEFVITIGDPSGRELASTATFGMISAVSRNVNIDGQTNEYIQTDAAMNPGNSGGPLINNRGEVIGVISAKTITASYDEYGNAISAEGLGFAIPIDNAIEIATKLITNGHIERPGIGISIVQGTSTLLEGTGLKSGAIVYSVTPGGPGDIAGLREEDIIVSYDGIEVTTTDEFISYIRSKKVGDEITLRYYRDGNYNETVLKIGDLNLMG